MTTLKDIARIVGVAPSTVSGVINGNARVGRETKERILKVVRELDYTPNAVAKGLRLKSTATVGLLIPSITNPFFPAVARGVEDVANAHGYNVFLCNCDRDEAKEKRYVRTLIDKQVDGIIFAAPTVSPKDMEAPTTCGVTVVVMNEAIDDQSVDEVWIDYVSGARALTEHLIALGHNRIGFIGGPPRLKRSQDRFAGYKQALRKHHLQVDNSLVRAGNFDYASGYELGTELLDVNNRRPTGIFAANDLMALGVLAAALDKGLRVPDDVSIAGFDNIDLCSYVRPKLTTVHQPNYEAGRVAMEMLIQRRNRHSNGTKVRIAMETTVIVRDSTAVAPG